jgi:hypothetical protein
MPSVIVIDVLSHLVTILLHSTAIDIDLTLDILYLFGEALYAKEQCLPD